MTEQIANVTENMDYIEKVEKDGLMFHVYEDKHSGKKVAIRAIRKIIMGSTSTLPGKIEEFVKAVEREDVCDAFWTAPGKMTHYVLAKQLRNALPQYRFELDYYGYLCRAYKDEQAQMRWAPDPNRPIGC